ncbi:hypothetical protein B0H15DRAFT_864036 [Mycena belliarum]|uniref:Uncharacterized protein n=1 Tax=Mycena belliarum TaxID=1033014 RepID=A0AAD6TT38_9AGAR|nr:hypothetical protein B0H15DRAFT_864036 [Mycena belliae]
MRVTAVLQALKSVIFSAPTPFIDAAQQMFVKTRVKSHYKLKNLEGRGVEYAYIRPTGWHGEGGKSGNNTTGHVTVVFKDKDDKHVTTHHVYQDDSHY